MRFDDGDVQEVVLFGKGAQPWAPYDGHSGYLERSGDATPRLGEGRCFRDRGDLMEKGPFTNSQKELMGSGMSTLACLLQMLGASSFEHRYLWDELKHPGVLLQSIPMTTGFPRVGDLVEQQSAHGTTQIPGVCLGIWVPFLPSVFSTNMSDVMWRKPSEVLDFNSAAPLGVQWRLKGSSRGGFSAKCFVLVSQANPVKEWFPEESISLPRYILFNRERPGRMISVQNATEAVRMYGASGVVLLERLMNHFPLITPLRVGGCFGTDSTLLMAARIFPSNNLPCEF